MKTFILRIALLLLMLLPAASRAGVITSALTASARSGDTVSYQITTTVSGGGMNFNAWDLPPGLTVDNSTGLISGVVNVTNSTGANITYTTWLGVGDENEDWAEDYLVWTITPIRQATVNPSASHIIQGVTQPVTLTRNGSVYYSSSISTETIIKRPNGTILTTSYSGFGSSDYTPDGGLGTYEYVLKVTDSTGASLISSPVVFSVGSIYVSNGPLPEIQVGQTLPIVFQVSTSNYFGLTAVTADPGLDAVFGGGYSAYTGISATIRAVARGSGSHWIWATVYGYPLGYSGAPPVPAGVWWGNGAFITVNKNTPTVTFSSRTLPANSSGYYTLVSGDFNAAYANPYVWPSALTVGNLSSVYYRLISSNVTLSASSQLPSGSYVIEVIYPGNGDYNATQTRATFTIGGPTTPRFFRAAPGSGSSVVLSWNGSTGATSYQVFRDGTSLGTTSSETFTDTGATAGAVATYTVKALDGSGNSSQPATAAYNALEILAPAL